MQGAGGLGCSLERHVCPFDALLLCDLLHRDVQGSAGARCPIIDLARVGTRVVDQLPECFPRRVTTDYDAKRVAADADDVGEIGRRIEAGLAHEGKTKDRYRYLHQRIAIGRGILRNLLRTQHTSGTGTVFTNNLLREIFLGGGGQRAHPDIGGSAGRPWHNQSHGAVGIALREYRCRDERENGDQYHSDARWHGSHPSSESGPIKTDGIVMKGLALVKFPLQYFCSRATLTTALMRLSSSSADIVNAGAR